MIRVPTSAPVGPALTSSRLGGFTLAVGSGRARAFPPSARPSANFPQVCDGGLERSARLVMRELAHNGEDESLFEGRHGAATQGFAS